MSLIRIGVAVIGSLVACSASASADVRYSGSPKFGQSITSQSQAVAPVKIAPITSPIFDANVFNANIFNAKAQLRAPQSRLYKGGIGARGI